MSDESLREYYEKLFNEDVYTVAAAAKLLEVEQNTVYTWIMEEKIKTIWRGVKKIPRNELIEYCLKKCK